MHDSPHPPYWYAPHATCRHAVQAEHLQHWGINMLSMEKTTKSMAELQIDLNMSFDFDKITESGTELEPLAGPGCAVLITPAMGLCSS